MDHLLFYPGRTLVLRPDLGRKDIPPAAHPDEVEEGPPVDYRTEYDRGA